MESPPCLRLLQELRWPAGSLAEPMLPLPIVGWRDRASLAVGRLRCPLCSLSRFGRGAMGWRSVPVEAAEVIGRLEVPVRLDRMEDGSRALLVQTGPVTCPRCHREPPAAEVARWRAHCVGVDRRRAEEAGRCPSAAEFETMFGPDWQSHIPKRVLRRLESEALNDAGLGPRSW